MKGAVFVALFAWMVIVASTAYMQGLYQRDQDGVETMADSTRIAGTDDRLSAGSNSRPVVAITGQTDRVPAGGPARRRHHLGRLE